MRLFTCHYVSLLFEIPFAQNAPAHMPLFVLFVEIPFAQNAPAHTPLFVPYVEIPFAQNALLTCHYVSLLF